MSKDDKQSTNDSGSIGLIGAISIGIGGMVGGGIFAVLGEAVAEAHGATAVAFLIAGVVAFLTAHSYARLATHFRSRGGTVVFIDKAFGHNLLSGGSNLMLWLSYLVTIALYAVAFASFGIHLIPGGDSPWLRHAMITLAIVLPLTVNLVNASLVSRMETVVVLIKLTLLTVIIAFGASHVDQSRMSPSGWGSSLSIATAGMIIFVAYEGFELIANSAEDIIDPKKNLPRAFHLSTLLVIVLYIMIAIITVGSVSEQTLMQAKDYALAVAARPSLGQLGFTIVSVAALLATFSAINATIYGNARLGSIIARNGRLPSRDDEAPSGTPEAEVWTIAVLSLVIANTIDLTQIAIIGSASFLLIFFLVNMAAFKLRDTIKISSLVSGMAILASAAAFIALMTHTFADNWIAGMIFVGFVLISILFEYLYGRLVRGHIFGRAYHAKESTAG